MNHKIKKTLLLFSSILASNVTFISFIACSKDDNQDSSSKREEEIKKINMELATLIDTLKTKLESFETKNNLTINDEDFKPEELDNIISILEDDSEKSLKDKIVDVLKIAPNEKTKKESEINNIKNQIKNLHNLDKNTLKTKIEELKVLKEKYIPIYKLEDAKKLVLNIPALSFDENDEEDKKFKIEVIKMTLNIKNLLKNKIGQNHKNIAENIEILALFLNYVKQFNDIEIALAKDSNEEPKILKDINDIKNSFNKWFVFEQERKIIENYKFTNFDEFIILFEQIGGFKNILKIFNEINEKITSDKWIYEKITAEFKSYLKKYTTEAEEFAIDINNDTSEEKIVKSYLLEIYNINKNTGLPDGGDFIINHLKKVYNGEKIEKNSNSIPETFEFLSLFKKEDLKKFIDKFENLKITKKL
ncbi:hypothetical protein [[Mycoplasma] collis]|uniref:hypothetical protein n=1 Tax=[Mycoplasma] collis TaxID=2127 RepID=UPI00051BC0D2|nr:hypothetical protein [[Mycoplasma] collis]